MSLPLKKLTAAALLTVGGLGGAASTAGSDLEPKPTRRPPTIVALVAVFLLTDTLLLGGPPTS